MLDKRTLNAVRDKLHFHKLSLQADAPPDVHDPDKLEGFFDELDAAIELVDDLLGKPRTVKTVEEAKEVPKEDFDF